MKLSVSMTSASLLCLERVIKRLNELPIDMIHFDIEDGCFVPEMNLGIKIINDLREITNLPFDVHLMVFNPEWLIHRLSNVGIEQLSVHYEATMYPRRLLRIINEANIRAGLAFNPKTEIPNLMSCFPYLNFVNILTTEPEVEGGTYLPSILDKVRTIKENPDYKDVLCEVDGGITDENINEVISAGADIVVSGRAIFKDGKIEENIKKLKY